MEFEVIGMVSGVIADGDESSLLLRVQQYRVACFPHHRSNEYVQFTRICRIGLP